MIEISNWAWPQYLMMAFLVGHIAIPILFRLVWPHGIEFPYWLGMMIWRTLAATAMFFTTLAGGFWA